MPATVYTTASGQYAAAAVGNAVRRNEPERAQRCVYVLSTISFETGGVDAPGFLRRVDDRRHTVLADALRVHDVAGVMFLVRSGWN